MPVPVPGVCGQAAKSVSGLPMTCSAAVAEEVRRRRRSRRRWSRSCRSGRRRPGRARRRPGGERWGATGPAERVPTGRSGRSSWNQTCLCVGVYSTPQREARAAQSSRPRPLSRSGLPKSQTGALERDLPFRIVVGDLDPDAVLRTQTQHVGGGAGVHHRVGDELAGEDDRVVDDVREAPALKGVADEGASGRDRAPDRVEGGSRPRGDHSTPHMVSRRFPESCARFSPLRFA